MPKQHFSYVFEVLNLINVGLDTHTVLRLRQMVPFVLQFIHVA